MGVNGLWKLVEPCGKPVPVDTLENKILAVDISIWLHQVIKGIQDSKGSAVAHAHLLGLFHRLCKLLYYKIKPVFVFDGSVPYLKKETIARRNMQRNKLINEADRIQALLLQSLAKERIVQQALGNNAVELLTTSPTKLKKVSNASDHIDNLFKLPEVSVNVSEDANSDSSSMMETTSQSESSFDETSPHHSYNQNLQSIDVKSVNFQNLPAEVRHEILVDIKETRKQSSWGKLHELPSQRDDFSSYQMKKLLKRRQVQECLEQAEKEMGGKTLTLHELKDLFTEEGIVNSLLPSESKKIISNDNARYLLVRDLKKSLPSKKETSVADKNISRSEYEKDMELAIKMSTSESASCLDTGQCSKRSISIKTATDDSECCEKDLKLSIQNISSDNTKTLLESRLYETSYDADTYETDLQLAIQMSLENNLLDDSKTERKENNNKMFIMDIDSSSTSSDLEEVLENSITNEKSQTSKNLEIYVDLTERINDNEDLFADIFEEQKASKPQTTTTTSQENAIKKTDNKQKNSEMQKTVVEQSTLSILGNLKKQIEEVHTLTLDEITIESDQKEIFKSESIRPDITEMENSIVDPYIQTKTIGKTDDREEENEKFFDEKDKKRSIANDDIETPAKKVTKISEVVEVIQKDPNVNDDPAEKKSVEEKIQNQIELEQLAQNIAKEKQSLEKERNRQDRMGISITERMNKECMQLLRLFGIPYIVAPMEAEAQCAFLDAMNLTNGTITDDSDIWLFGGRTVYKNFFAQNKNVLEYKAEHIEKTFNVDRNKLIQLAILVGSDYTTGVNGVGAVTALEILALFSTNEHSNMNEKSKISSVITTLRSFRDWLTSHKGSLQVGSSAKISLRKKLKNIELQEGFPSVAVAEAYLTPQLDDSTETFSWNEPDLESIREFTKANFGWTRSKTDDILTPVLKKMKEKMTQATIKNYFACKRSIPSKQVMLSRRVQRAINKLSNCHQDSEEEEIHKQGTSNSKAKKTKRKPKDCIAVNSSESSSSSKNFPKISNDIIPQREMDKIKMDKNKEIAISLLKTKKNCKPKKK